jgi:hypothetical protein
MKKIFTFLLAFCIGTLCFGQTIFQSNLSSWSGGNPTDWMGNKSTISSANVVEQTVGATYGTSAAYLINATTNHKRFTTQPISVTPGETYQIEMWVSGLVGDLRTNFYDTTNAVYGSYNPYVLLSGGNLTHVTQVVTMPATCNVAEFILSLRNTDATGISLDSVAISVTAPPVATPATIYQIQNTTTPPYDSPYNGQLVETSGVVTAAQYNGYYLQDGNGAWNGVFVLDYTNVPALGDVVSVTGLVDEYFNYTTLKNISVYSAVAGGTLPAPTILSTIAVNNEQYEGVLVKATNANCIADTAGNGFGEWTINDGSGSLIIDDKMFAFGPTVSVSYDVTGVVDYSFSSFKVLPRDANDVSIATAIFEVENDNFLVYPNPTSGVLNFEIEENNVTVQIFDITGKTLKSITAHSNKFSVSLSNFSNGIYFYSIIGEMGSSLSTNKFIIAK